ncbi:WD40/YVTN/BNR-like repeat-containing protein [Spirosoma endophyticum]|uniref:BNR/Asp-box repeat-containing protein n=1 Tax=Spirosoma endophyticum TaxID=662367 RepID=A0A1I2AUH4_9BACT|nr:glycosyl hydrolase [Spirosoma endophyticum]SFE47389.1 BNR/Asp-box repeat-containing protein [Spirosoma endophyticum]
MDVSSRYYNILKIRDRNLLKYLWGFLLSIYRVGKLRELSSFCYWEVNHRFKLYRPSRYILFQKQACLLLNHQGELSDQASLVNDQIALEAVGFERLMTDWKYCIEAADYTLWGCRFSNPTALYHSENQLSTPVLVHSFTGAISSMFISRNSTLFVCCDGLIYRSMNRGISFEAVLHLSSSVSYFLYNNGMTELPNQVLLLGEYGSIWNKNSWQNLAFLYYSTDGGQTWNRTDFLQRSGVNKHIHVVRYSPHLKAIVLTDGDNRKQLWLNSTLTHFSEQVSKKQPGWRLVNRFHHQMGGYLSMAETGTSILLGSDYLGGTNFLIQTQDGRRFEKKVMSDPYRRSPVVNMVTRETPTGNEIWAITYSCLSSHNRCLLMYTKDSGKTWVKVIDFDGTQNEVRLVTSSVNPSSLLFISITYYGKAGSQLHTHQLYSLK